MIQSNEVRISELYTDAYLRLSGVLDVVSHTTTTTDAASTTAKEVKPYLTQIREFLSRFGSSPAARATTELKLSTNEEPDKVVLRLPESTLTFSERFSMTVPPLQYKLMEHVRKELHVQLAYLASRGVSVWSIVPDDIYVVEVSPGESRMLLLTSNVSVGVEGTSQAMAKFVNDSKSAKLQSKMSSYVLRVSGSRMSLWV
jgi:hypothetical protein